MRIMELKRKKRADMMEAETNRLLYPGIFIRKEVWLMKIIFHPDFFQEYALEPAAAVGRLEPSYKALAKAYTVVEAEPCGEEDILLVHTEEHLADIRRGRELYRMAMLAAGAAVMAAESAMRGDAAFALCRPPGHHASAGSCWGFCYFNNVAVAVRKLLEGGRISSAMIVDFDLHFGDGTSNIFAAEKRVAYWHRSASGGQSFVRQLEKDLAGVSHDLLAVSAGFDRHARDWGGMLSTENYYELGRVLGRHAREKCDGRLFAVLEGGYNAHSMAESVEAFCKAVAEELE